MTSLPSDLIGAELRSPLGGSPLVMIDVNRPVAQTPAGGIRIGVDRTGALPPCDPADFDALVTVHPAAPAPWVGVAPARLDQQLATAAAAVRRTPVAATMAARVVRLVADLDPDAALDVESLAYSTLLGGAEFARWRGPQAGGPDPDRSAPLVEYARERDHVTLTLTAPASRNAMTAAMRDALYEALVNVLEDPSLPTVDLCGAGRCFSTGGDLAEFGKARDLAAAHVIRTQRSCARVLHRLGRRATARLHGACIGSGIEIPAAAAHRVGAADLVVQLPELRMGLIPGAGGTVTIGRAIGRHRLLWLLLGGFRIDAQRALAWGLIHGIAA